MKFNEIDIGYSNKCVLSDIKSFENKHYRFIKKDVNDIEYDYSIISCVFEKNLSGDNAIKMKIQNISLQKFYGIIEQFHKGRWLTQIFEIDQDGEIINE